MAAYNPVPTGLRGRCSNCGKGSVYDGYLKLKPKCEVCGADWSNADTGDGPSFFVTFAALILFAPFFFLLPLIGWPWPALVFSVVIVAAAMLAFMLWGLRVGKAILLNLQVANRAEEARFEEPPLS